MSEEVSLVLLTSSGQHVPIEAVSFDVWMTLLESNPAFHDERVHLLAEFFEVSPEEMRTASHRAGLELDQWTMQTGRDVGFPNRVAHIAGILNLAQRLQSKRDQLPQLQEAVNQAFLQNLPLLLEGKRTLDTLRTLRRAGLKLFLVSNTGLINGVTMRKALSSLEILGETDAALFSNEGEGWAKPHPKIFQALRPYQANLSKILHVGDNPLADYQGADHAGLQALLFNRHGRKFDPIGASIGSIAEVCLRLGVEP